jgi:hypothetical protein
MNVKKRSFACLCLIGAALLPGCAKGPPVVTEAEGRVLLDGRPLPSASVQFIPQLDGYGAEWNSAGFTDADGKFQLKCALKNQPGAVVGAHWVVVTEMPIPGEYRSQENQGRYEKYLTSLANRPIPTEYGELRTTPLKVEVKKGQKTYELTLKRGPTGPIRGD